MRGSYQCTMDLHKPGMDEGSIAELRNGSVMAILRNNLGGGRFQCALSSQPSGADACVLYIHSLHTGLYAYFV